MVDKLADTADANPGNGIAADANGKTSLRAAIEESNARGKGDVWVDFNPELADGNGKINISLSKSIEVTEAISLNGDFGTQYFVKITSAIGFSQLIWDADGGQISSMQFTGAKTEGDGGAIYITTGNSLGIYNCSFVDNKANNGGAIKNEGSLTIGESSFHANIAVSGGAISSSGTSLAIWYTSLSSNNASGAGAVETSDEEALFSNCYFVSNSSTGSAGALYIDTGETTFIDQCTFEKNTAVSDGGAIFARWAKIEICETLFTENTTYEGNGGAIYMIGSETIIIYSTFYANTAIYAGTDPLKGNGGAVLIDDSEVDIQESDFSKNSATRAGHCVSYIDGKNYNFSYDNNQGLEGNNWLGEAE